MDETSRDLARRALQDETPEAQAKALVARVRAGGLDPQGLRLAAFSGHAGALLAVACRHDDIGNGDRGCLCWYGACQDLDYGERRTWSRWIGGLYRTFGMDALLRASILSARVAIARVPGLGCEREEEITNAAEAYQNSGSSDQAMRYWVSTIGGVSPGEIEGARREVGALFGHFVPFPVRRLNLGDWHLDANALASSCISAYARVEREPNADGPGILKTYVRSCMTEWALR